MGRRQYAGAAIETTITGPILASGGGTVDIAGNAGWPDGATGPFAVVVDARQANEEKILVTSRTGSTLTYSSGNRGYDSTAASAHSSTAAIYLVGTAVDFDEANAHINATSGGHAATAISFAPTGTVAATTVQAAIAEVASDYAGIDSTITAAYTAADTALSGRVTTLEAGPADGSITTAKIAASAVTSAKIALSAGVWTKTTTTNCPGSGANTTLTWTAETRDDLSLAAPTFSTFSLTAGVWVVEVALASSAAPGDASVRLSAAGVSDDRKVSTLAYGTFRYSFPIAVTGTTSCSVVYANGGSTIDVTNATLTIVKVGGI